MNWYEIERVHIRNLSTGPDQVVEYACRRCQTRGMVESADGIDDALAKIPDACPWCEWEGDGE